MRQREAAGALPERDRISVIIPVYNVERYLKRCVDSVLKQTYTDLEIWLVDDGSTDSSVNICDEYALQDDRIRVIHQENMGQSAARNAALEKMTGTMVLFVDSDDFVHEKMTEKLYNLLTETSSDMVSCFSESGSGDHFAETETIPGEAAASREVRASYDPDGKDHGAETYEGDDRFYCLFDERYRINLSVVWGKLYRREVFDDLRFAIGRIHEDELAMHHILGNCSRIAFTFERLYYYFERGGSTTNTGYRLKYLDLLYALEDRCSYFDQKGKEKLGFLSRREYLRRSQWHYYSMRKYHPDENEKARKIKDTYRSYYDEIREHMTVAEKMRYGLFLWMPGVNRALKSLAGAQRV